MQGPNIMELTPSSNHYELLDVHPDASPQEIRAAYLRAKTTFQKDSLAIYSLMDASDAQDMLQKIEQAYQVLSHPDRKRVYDQNFSQSMNETEIFPTASFSAPTPSKVVSIDRVPPMESGESDDLLVPPTTDYPLHSTATANEARSVALTSSLDSLPSHAEEPSTLRSERPQDPVADLHLENQEEWTGALLRKIRELRDVPMERLIEVTRVRRSYLAAIEQDQFDKLPAPVFVRGFLMQIARELKIPSQQLVSSYLGRLEGWSVSQSRKSR